MAFDSSTWSGNASWYSGWSMGNHITSCGLTSPTVSDHGLELPALRPSQSAAWCAIHGSNSVPVPAHPMKCWSLPDQSEKPWASMSGVGP